MESIAAILEKPTSNGKFTESKPATICEIEVEEPTGEEVLVEIVAGSLCHTDVAMALGNINEQYPLVMGHEGAGIVRQVGDSVTTLSPGDHVVLGRPACGICEYCRQGRSNLCNARLTSRHAGTLRTGERRFYRDGEKIYHCHGVSSFTQFTNVTEEVAIKINDKLPLDEATLLGCGVFTGAGAVMNTANIEAGASVAIFGAGGVGLSALQGAVVRGAVTIIAVDMIPEKLQVAKNLGATHTINASEEDPVDRIKQITDGRGVDYAFDVVGNPKVVEQAVESLHSTGSVVLVGTTPAKKHTVNLNLYEMVVREKSIIGSFNGSYSLQTAIPMLADLVVAGHMSLKEMISSKRPLSEINEAMEALEEGGSAIRQVILPPK